MYYSQILQIVIENRIVFLILTIVTFVYYYYWNVYKFFKRKNIEFLQPQMFIGNLGPRIFMKRSIPDFQKYVYDYFKRQGYPYAGIFEGQRPALVVLNPDLIKNILVRDFDHFMDRNLLETREPQYAKRSLLNLKGQEWKAVRSILTPAFSSARLRSMMPLIQHCSTQLVQLLKKRENEDVEMKYFFGHMTMEVIGACAFGMKCDVISDKNSQFLEVAEKYSYMSPAKRMLLFILLILGKQFSKFINFSFYNPETAQELLKLLTVNKKMRRGAQTKSSDFLQLMIDAAEKERSESKESNSKIYLDDDTIDAQSLMFLLAGYETSSTLLSFAVHVLATKPDIQDKLRAHINEIMEDKEISYELLSQMTYLDSFLMETLRLYPPLLRVDRLCTKQYVLPGTDVKIDVGDVITIPVYGIHMDADIYPEPEEFQPERWNEEKKKARPAHTFLGFGAGPRNCIGLRFAMITAKLAMVDIMKSFKFTKCTKTEDPVTFDKRSFLLKPACGLWVRVELV